MSSDTLQSAIASIRSGDKETGISIHYVNKYYDEGEIIFQAKCAVEDEDTAESIARKVHALEYKHFPRIIEDLMLEVPKK